MPEVCGGNCVTRSAKEVNEVKDGRMSVGKKQGSGWERAWRERIARKREHAEQDFVANIRNVDAEWMCPCCRHGTGRSCVAVLGGKFQ